VQCRHGQEGSDGNPDTYRPFGTQIHPDVHSISLHAAAPDLLTAPTGGGLYRSTNGGNTWRCLYRCYCRAAWVDPQDAARWTKRALNLWVQQAAPAFDASLGFEMLNFMGSDAAEGAAALKEKRKPDFPSSR